MPVLWLLLGPSVGARRNLQQRRSHAGALRVRSRRGLRHEMADLGITTEPRELTASQSRPAEILTTAAVPRRSAALDVCVASTIAAAAQGDAAQGAFDRKLTHYRNEIGPISTHRFQSERAAFVGEVTSQMEARNPNRSPAPEGHGTRSSAKSIGKGSMALRWYH